VKPRLLGHGGTTPGLNFVYVHLNRAIERAGEAGRLALDVFAHRVAAAVAAMSASLGGIDALVFTAGIGERAAGVRSAICSRLAFLGVRLDEDANARADGDAEISPPAAGVAVRVVVAREDVVIARETRRVLV
jgi:acetate kinase